MKKYNIKLKVSDWASFGYVNRVVEACTFSQAIAKTYQICDDYNPDCSVEIISIAEAED